MHKTICVVVVVAVALLAISRPIQVPSGTEVINRMSVDDFNKTCKGHTKLADPTIMAPGETFNAVLIVNPSTCVISELIELPQINSDGNQTITLPKGLKFYGMAYHYNHSQYRDSRVLYETATLPRQDGVAPRSYTITIKEQ